jgi:polyhydroxyalkanoate synthase subunit PhaC
MFPLMDALRQAQGQMLDSIGFAPHECSYRILASGQHWRLRAYDGPGAGPCLVIVSAPIKKPYIWDLAPSVSAIRYCLGRDLRVFLVEWIPPEPTDGDAGLDEYADRALDEATTCVAEHANGAKPFLMGHSLGGTFAAIFTALAPERIQGLVLLGAPLSFHQGVSRFRDSLVALAPSSPVQAGVMPGSFLSTLSAMASPETFVWSRLIDATLSMGDRQASDIHARVERWALDEVPLSGTLVSQILEWLYRENRFCRRTLSIRGRIVGPSDLQVPLLAVVNPADEVAPKESVAPFLDALPHRDVRLIIYPGEFGVGFQHLGILVGRKAYAEVWPEIIAWLGSHGKPQDVAAAPAVYPEADADGREEPGESAMPAAMPASDSSGFRA